MNSSGRPPVNNFELFWSVYGRQLDDQILNHSKKRLALKGLYKLNACTEQEPVAVPSKEWVEEINQFAEDDYSQDMLHNNHVYERFTRFGIIARPQKFDFHYGIPHPQHINLLIIPMLRWLGWGGPNTEPDEWATLLGSQKQSQRVKQTVCFIGRQLMVNPEVDLTGMESWVLTAFDESCVTVEAPTFTSLNTGGIDDERSDKRGYKIKVELEAERLCVTDEDKFKGQLERRFQTVIQAVAEPADVSTLAFTEYGFTEWEINERHQELKMVYQPESGRR